MPSFLSALAFSLISLLLSACSTLTVPVEPATTTPAPSPAIAERPIKIALVLGGGAARGFAHIGVIKALEAQGITPDLIVGTSVGSVVGALYASGYNGFELQKLALTMNEADVSDWVFPGARGVLKGEALQNYVNRMVNQRPIEKLPRPLAIVATELQSGQMVVFQRGNTGMAARASSSIPGLFQPVQINGKDYVDGGLVSPVPIQVARTLGADVVIAVDISAQPDKQPVNDTLDLLLQTFTIMAQSISRYELSAADVVIRPALGEVKSTDFAARHVSILEGEKAAAAQLRLLKQKIAAARVTGIKQASASPAL